MQTRLTNSFITSARLISTQTLPRARRETGTHRPLPPQPSLSCGRGVGARGAHAWGARTGGQDSGQLVGTHWEIGDVVLGQAGAPWGALCPLEHKGHVGTLYPSLHRPPCLPHSRLARSRAVLPGVGIRPCWLPAQLGLALAPAWRHRGGCVGWEGGCRGSVYRCPDAPGERWSSHRQLGSAGRCRGPSLGVSWGQHWLIVARSQPLPTG